MTLANKLDQSELTASERGSLIHLRFAENQAVASRMAKARRRSRVSFALTSCAVAGLTSLAILATLIVWAAGRQPLPPRGESPTAKIEEVVSAFESGVPSTDHGGEAGIDEFFDELGKATHKHDTVQVASLFDSARAYQEVVRVLDSKPTSFRYSRYPSRKLRELMATTFADAVAKQQGHFDVRRIKRLNDREVVAYVRWRTDDELAKSRWWLVQRRDGWRIYDFEDLHYSTRWSSMCALGIDMNHNARSINWQHSKRLKEAILAIRQRDPHAVQHRLGQINEQQLPAPLQALFWQLRALAQMDLHQCEQALESCDRAQEIHDDVPELDLIRAICCNRLGKFHAARQAAQSYLDQLGDDATGYFQLGYALRNLRQDRPAIHAFRSGLDDDPDSFLNLVQLGIMLPEDEKVELKDRVAKMQDAETHFGAICELFAENDDRASMRHVVDAYAERCTRDVRVAYYDAYASGRWHDVIRIHDEIKVQMRDDTESFRWTVVRAMYRVDRALDALAKTLPARDVFDQLARLAAEDGDFSTLRQLISLHRRRDPDDPNLYLWFAEYCYQKGDFVKSTRAIREYESMCGAAVVPLLVVDRKVRCLVRLGQNAAAMAVATEERERSGDPLYQAIVHAAQGDVEAMARLLGECKRIGYQPSDFLNDDIIGPTLREVSAAREREKRTVWRSFSNV